MGSFLMLCAYALAGYVACRTAWSLLKAYPNEGWWKRYIPLAGLALMLNVAGGSWYAYFPGIALIVACVLFLPKESKDQSTAS